MSFAFTLGYLIAIPPSMNGRSELVTVFHMLPFTGTEGNVYTIDPIDITDRRSG